MTKKIRKQAGRVLTAILAGFAAPSFAAELDPGLLKVSIYGRSQMVGVAETLPDPVRNDSRLYLFMKQSRLGFKGLYDDVGFDMQFAFGGESANGSNTDLSLLDFVVDLPLGGATSLKIGQFRVPYSREGLTDRGTMNFAERSIMNMASFQSRDYGLALQRNKGKFAGTLGVFSAGGRDVPQRYLPEVLGIPEVVARVGYNDGVDEDIYHIAGADVHLRRATKAFYLNALYMKDTLIGHSTVLNVRTIDKNLLIDPSYNQFISAGPGGANGTAATLRAGELWFAGGDAVWRRPLGGGKSLGVEAEINYGSFRNEYGRLRIASGRVQGNYQWGPYDLGLRYAALKMDPVVKYRSAGKFFDSNMGPVIHEVTPSAAWRLKGNNLKIIADAPVFLEMPLFIETGVGAYVFAEQPGQVSSLATAGNSTVRDTVVQARLLFQFLF